MENLQIYYKDINRYPLLTKEEEEDLIFRAKFGEEAAKSLLINSNLRFVVSIAKKFLVPNVEIDDLIQEGNIGLIRSIEKFDPSRKVKFLSYAVWWIKQAMYSYINENSRTIRLTLNQIRSNNAYKKMKNELEKLGIDSVNMEDFDFYEHTQISLHDDVDGEISILETISNENADEPDRQLIAESLKRELDSMFKTLPERDRQILKLYYGVDCDRAYALGEIGDMLSLTRERVRQIKEIALNRLSLKPKFSTLVRYL